ncbi:glucosylglycerol hydrolase [Leptothoe spongobia]|uniref:Alpha-amylase n=1 Tax=Leptothoe spongobia TAU-MAC 1115 TaxID=1967444 RepID=A0A947DHL5_9CYAN|nr:glucosylglycerol hydrolase [Leptothoe spongobia]MBT9317105.1 alpha-amylase [Leptothoe spongobia TAU-MAC 1115]
MIATAPKKIQLIEDETQSLLIWAESIQRSEATFFEKAQKIARRLGAHYRADRLTEVGFWTPDLTGDIIQSEDRIVLEIYTPTEDINFRAAEQTVAFNRTHIPLVKQGEFVWGVIEGMRPGRRDRAGCFYWLRYTDQDGRVHIIRDPLAYSLPYGIFAPAELYDMRLLQRQRADRSYFRRTGSSYSDSSDIPRLEAPTNILQLHVKTASPQGTFEGLTEIYQHISDKLTRDEELTAQEAVYAGYDAIQLLPVVPTIEYRREDTSGDYEFFSVLGDTDSSVKPLSPDNRLTDLSSNKNTQAVLRRPDTQNWGYDVPILGSGTTNPSVLGSLRPDEVIDFIATLHNFSEGPIQLIYDLVYGHADNQALEVMTHQFFKGPNMYGQDLNHQLPQVRAILLEMQRRKINTGADGIRVDGGQDFRFFNPLTDRVEQDDAYLLAMSDVVQDINGYRRLMFTIFEDGRPWPQEGWEEISRYRELIEQKPESFQWGPLIFAHNTPSLKGFWDRKWRRVGEVIFQGNRWITGCGNHDTVRRGTQVKTDQPINWNLGKTLPNVLHKAYNNPATQLWVCGFSPGLPMDFINANVGAPWGFFRNTDDQYGVKVVSEEISFLDWQIEPDMYDLAEVYPQLKQMGFREFEQLRDFSQTLQEAMVSTDYNLQEVATICSRCLGPNIDSCELPTLAELNESSLAGFLANLDVPKLKKFAMAFMEDGHDLCNVSRSYDRIDQSIATFHLALRQYRRRHPWLQDNLTGRDRFNRISDDQRTVFYGLRSHPDRPGEPPILMVAHMGGAPLSIELEDWLGVDMQNWEVAISTPDLNPEIDLKNLSQFTLKDSQGVLFEQKK